MDFLLLWTFMVPLATAALLLLLPRKAGRAAHKIAVLASGVTLLLALAVFLLFDRSRAGEFQFLSERRDWIESLGLTFQIGVDGMSLVLVLLAAIVGFAATIVSR